MLLFNLRNEIKLKIMISYVKEKYVQKGNNNVVYHCSDLAENNISFPTKS